MHPALRPARSDDVDRIHQLVVDLATYERAADQVRATPEQLRGSPLRAVPGRARAGRRGWHGVVVGFALWFLSFSTWEGVHGIYLEDLYVEPAAPRLRASAAPCCRRWPRPRVARG